MQTELPTKRLSAAGETPTGFAAKRLPAVGDPFGDLTVIALPENGKTRLSKDRWQCRCTCGKTPWVPGRDLIYKARKSCGCASVKAQRAWVEELRRQHSARVSWKSMLRRADATIDPQWAMFEPFFAVMGTRPVGHLLSRHDFDGPYNAVNCFWEERRTQLERIRAFRWPTPNALGWQPGPLKQCSKCREEKPVGDFYGNSASKTKLHSACKGCADLSVQASHRKNIAKYLLTSAKSRALATGIEFDLKLEDLVVPEYCPVFGFKMAYATGRGRTDTSYSIDRLDNSRGYVKGNVAVISWLANRLKNNATCAQLERVTAWMHGESAFFRASAGMATGLL